MNVDDRKNFVKVSASALSKALHIFCSWILNLIWNHISSRRFFDGYFLLHSALQAIANLEHTWSRRLGLDNDCDIEFLNVQNDRVENSLSARLFASIFPISKISLNYQPSESLLLHIISDYCTSDQWIHRYTNELNLNSFILKFFTRSFLILYSIYKKNIREF